MNPKCELYDLEQDPSEEKDISKAYPEVVARLTKEMDAQHILSEHEKFRLARER